ncbi:cadherin-89D-like isoform X2 [Toxorhynchites rutilus septentrionalis]|uniref:cadherin-89D-like isoform X2 n=1 Tax=Toxorhynchites rutilus septentrionalis TaxID=329112 RepID=UPI002478923B|nr:cadherin-89D-like isoform X2 [Toxorhynchites rutilus septentrionalis]
MSLLARITQLLLFLLFFNTGPGKACKLYSKSNLRTKADGVQFLRLKEDFPVGGEIVSLYAFPRNSILIARTENSSDSEYFKLKEVNNTVVSVILNRSLDQLVDNENPQSILKFSVFCSGTSTAVKQDNSSFFTITVYIEDINDNDPEFINLPYALTVDESTPIETAVFNRIKAIDRDKPNTPNSDIEYAIAPKQLKSGDFPFRLESAQKPKLILQRPLDYDAGLHSMSVLVIATDRGNPPRSANATVRVTVRDVDDLAPIFTRAIYRTKLRESFPVTGKPVHVPIPLDPPIGAFDQDSLNATLIYGIVGGNERKVFWMSPDTGMLFLQKEIDLEAETLPDNTMVLQIEAKQANDQSKSALARVEIEIVDVNDNLPEFEVDLYNISIIENLPKGFSILQVNAIDRDQGENAEFYYYLASEEPKGAFVIDHVSGWIVVKDETYLDKETRSSLHMAVNAMERIEQADRNRNYGTVQVEITLLDTNDNTPEFEKGTLYEFKANCSAAIGSKIGAVKANDPDDMGNGQVQYSIKNVRPNLAIPFKLDPDTGDLLVAEALTYGKIAFFVEARDQPLNPSESRFNVALVTIDIVCQSIEQIEFIGAPYEFWVGADAAVGSSVGQIRTTFDSNAEEEIFFDLLHSYPEGVPFAIEERSGIVTVIEALDKFDRRCYEFETVVSYLPNAQGKAVDQLTPEAYNNLEKIIVTNVTIHVIKNNFMLLRGTNSTPIEFRIKENQPNSIIGQLQFQGFQEQCEADEKGPPSLISVRGDRQIFNLNGKNRTRYGRRIIREASVDYVQLYPLVSFDAMYTTNASRKARSSKSSRTPTSGVQYSLVNSYDHADLIHLTNDGKLMTVKGLDREKQDTHKVTIIAEYFFKHRTFAGIYQVVILVEDENDNPPAFNQPFYLGVIAENSPIGTEIVLNNPIIITDSDVGANAEYELNLSGESDSFAAQFSNATLSNYNKTVAHIFKNLQIANVNPAGEVINRRMDFRPKPLEGGNGSTPHYNIIFMGPNKLDREEIDSLSLKMMATDRDSLTSEVELRILILDVNDNAPIFEKVAIFRRSKCEMVENRSDLELLYVDELEAEMPSEFAQPPEQESTRLGYGVESLFELVQSAAYVGMPRVLDGQLIMESSSSNRSTMTMIRRKPFSPKSRLRAGVRSSREFGKKSGLKFSLPENVEVGKVILKLTANDDDFDKNSKVFYEVVDQEEWPSRNSSNYFKIDRNSGELKATAQLPPEAEIRMNISAKDTGGLADVISLEFKVYDVNDNSPVFEKQWYTFNVEEGIYSSSGKEIGQVTATDDDLGMNGNVSYLLLAGDDRKVPFFVSPTDGTLYASGEIDREMISSYQFKILASDNNLDLKRSAMVDIEVIVLDKNDNSPEFTAYDELRYDDNKITRTPVYLAHINVNSKPGTFVKQVQAADSDFKENGNGLIIYSLTGQTEQMQFGIDPKDGVITTASKYTPPATKKNYQHLNVTVVASDFGTPSRWSTALLIINLQGDPERVNGSEEKIPLFPYRYYEIELRENDSAPKIVLNVTLSKKYAKEDAFRWEIVDRDFDERFKIDEKNGSLWLLRPLDREERASYEIKIRVEKLKSRESRNIPSVLYALENPVKKKSQKLNDNEVEIHVKVIDVNDNAPIFKGNDGPIIAVVPDRANYGYPVMKVEAYDEDTGSNGEVRYSLLNEPARLFDIDAMSGQIRLLSSLLTFQDRVFGFDVKATDRVGADDGKSTIANVFVYVLNSNQEVCLVLSGPPVEIEKQLGMITGSLTLATGYDVRIRALESNEKVDDATNLYLYAVDRKSNSLVEMAELQRSLASLDMSNLKPNLPIIELSDLSSNILEPHPYDAGMKGIELATVVVGGLIFAGGTATALCIACARYRRLIPLPNISGGGGGGSQGIRATSIRNTASNLGVSSGCNTTAASAIGRSIATRVDIQPVINRADLKNSIFHPNFHRQFVTSINTEANSAAVAEVNEDNNSDSYEDSLKDSLASNTSL